jgi:hypothetical protein
MQQDQTSQTRSRVIRISAVALIVAGYISALNLPVVVMDDFVVNRTGPDPLITDLSSLELTFTGADALNGWRGLGVIPELANVALAGGAVALLLGRIKLATAMGVLGTLLALTAPYIFGIHISSLRVAYYLWLVCMVALLAAAYASRVTTSPFVDETDGRS